jgi:hypothetical protein
VQRDYTTPNKETLENAVRVAILNLVDEPKIQTLKKKGIN